MENKGKLKEFIVTIVIALALALAINLFFGVASIVGHSMSPSLENGEYKLILKIAYDIGEPERNDIAIFYPSEEKDIAYVKRVIGVPGDTVAIRDNAVYRNGERLEEDYLFEPMETPDMNDTELLKGEYFLMGDNRNNSTDCRYLGPIRKEYIFGKIMP